MSLAKFASSQVLPFSSNLLVVRPGGRVFPGICQLFWPWCDALVCRFCPAPGHCTLKGEKSANARHWPGGGGWAFLELTDALHVNSKPYVIYYKDSDRVCFSEKFEVKVYAIQEKFFTVTDIITVILCKRLHYMMRLCFRRK